MSRRREFITINNGEFQIIVQNVKIDLSRGLLLIYVVQRIV